MRLILSILGVLCPLILAGCGTASLQVQHWVGEQGGLAAGQQDARAQAIGRLVLGTPDGRPMRVYVLQSSRIGAYSWPDGDIFVTRGLMEAFDDESVAAAIAHEAGHLARPMHPARDSSPFGATGDPDIDVEASADALGAVILARRGLSPQAMQRMLEQLAASPQCPECCRRALWRRVELLRSRRTGEPGGANHSAH